MTEGIDIRLEKTPPRPGYSSNTWNYVLRSKNGETFMSLGGTPCLLGIVFLRANGEARSYSGSSNLLTSSGRMGVLSMDDATSVMRLYIATEFKEHTVPFTFENLTKAAPLTDEKPAAETTETPVATAQPEQADEALIKAMNVRLYEIQLASTIDATLNKPMVELTVSGYATLDIDLPVISMGTPVIDKIIDGDGSAIVLPVDTSPFEPMLGNSYGSSSKGKVRYNISATRTDLPRLPQQAQQIIGHMTVLKTGETQAKAFEKLERDQKLELPGGATLRLYSVSTRSSSDSWSASLEYIGPYRPTAPKPGEPAITEIRLVDDQGEEIAMTQPLRINANLSGNNQYRDSFSVYYKLPTGRTPAGLRVYYTEKTSALIVPFTLDLTQPVVDEPSAM